MVKLTRDEVQILNRHVDERYAEVKYLISKIESNKLKKTYEKEIRILEGIRSKFQSELKG